MLPPFTLYLFFGQVVTLENNDEIQGLAATPAMLFLVTAKNLYRIAVANSS